MLRVGRAPTLMLLAAIVRVTGGWTAFGAAAPRRSPHRVAMSPQLMFSGIGVAFAFFAFLFRNPLPRALPAFVCSHCLSLTAYSLLLCDGAVEEMGTVRKLEKVDRLEMWDGTFGEGWELEVEAQEALGQASLGCSIAVNGVCLTVTEFDDASFKVGLAPETLRRSNLADLNEGSPVNLERALPADGRNSGHFVQGHVDDVGVIKELRPDGDSLYVTVQPPARLMPYIVPKGFIAIDGTSLTVCDVDQAAGAWLWLRRQSSAPPPPPPPTPPRTSATPATFYSTHSRSNNRHALSLCSLLTGTFNFMLIAFTQSKVIIPKKAVGETVNLEVDVISKYVEQSLAAVVERVATLEAKLEALAAK